MKTRGNNMKKCYSLFAALFAATSLFAADILEIRPCDQYGNSVKNADGTHKPATDIDNPYGSGVDIYFNIRLVSRENNTTVAKSRSSFQVAYNPASGVSYEIAKTIPFKIGIVTRAGKTEWAELVDNAVVRTMSDESNYTLNLFNAVFKYRTQPGDFALPVKLAKDLNGTPVGEDDSATGCITYPSSPWDVYYYSADGSVTNKASFTFCSLPPREEGGATIDISDTPDTEDTLNSNYSLRQCGYFVKTVDFKDATRPYAAGAAWNEVPQGSDAKFQLEAAAELSEATTLYVWSQDEDVLKLVNSEALYVKNVEAVTFDVPDAGGKPVSKEVQVATVLIQGGQTLGNFAVRGMKEGETANLVLSSFRGYNWNKEGRLVAELIEDFLTVPVKCVEPQPPALELTRVNAAETEVAVTPDYATAVSQLRLSLKGQTYSNAMTVTLAPVLKGNESYPTNRYARINLEGTPDGWMNESPLAVTLNAGETSATIDVFGMGAKSGITDGPSKYVEFSIVDVQPADAKAFLTGGYDSKTFLRLKPNTPTMTKPEEGFVDTATSGADYQITVGIEDNWNNADDTNTCYTLYLAEKRATDKYWGDWKKLGTNYVVASNGQLYEKNDDGTPNYSKPPTYVFEYSGKIQVSVYAVAPNGETSPTKGMNASSLRENGRRFTVSVSEPAKVNAKFFVDKTAKELLDVNNVNEGKKSYGYVKVYLDEAPGKQVYAFLAPRDSQYLANISGNCLTNSAKAGGIPIGGQSKESTSIGQIAFEDGEVLGTTIYFDVILCTTQTYSPDKIFSGYVTGDDTQPVTVYNVEPTLDTVKMSGTTLKPSPESTVTPQGVPRTFSFSVSDVSQIDRDAKNTAEQPHAAMQLKYSVYENCDDDFTGGNAIVEDTVIEGGLYNFKTNFVHTFENIGNARIDFAVMDKDMYAEDEGGWSDTVSYNVVVSDKPSIWVEGESGANTFSETQPNQPGGVPLYVRMSEKASKDLDVKLTVTPPADAKPGMLILGGSGVTQAADGTYTLAIKAGKTEYQLYVAAADGTAASAAKGFYIKAEVTTEDVNPATKRPWSEYYVSEDRSFYIGNVEPTISCVVPRAGGFTLTGNMGDQNTKTNAIPTGIGEAPTITWSASDVTNDFSTFSVKWTSNDRTETWSNPGTPGVTNNVQCSFTPKFDLAGYYQVTVEATDKDGGITTAQWWYEVQASKTLITRAHGPFGGSTDTLSARYSKAKGIGAGHTYADSTYAGADRWRITWNCGLNTEIDIYAWGYQPGVSDNGTLDNNRDVSLDENGNNTTTSKATVYNPYYKNELTKCSYFYRWVPILVSESAAEQTVFSTIAPAQPVNNSDGNATVKLPGEKDDNGNYDKTTVEAIFSQEWLTSDNMGDINQDGIPDIYVAGYTGFGIVDDGGALVDGANDLVRLDAFNDDEDYLPNMGSATFANFIPALSNSWVTEGRAFTALLEIRGWGTNLNDAVNKEFVLVSGVKPDIVYEDPQTCPTSTLTRLEWDAYVQAGKPGYGTAHPENYWSPERPTDPTMVDTDEDGLPDGYEYYIWYKATVGYMDNDANDAFDVTQGVHKYLTGRRYNPINPSNPTVISPADIAAKFDPLTPLAEDYDTMDTDWDGIPDAVEFMIGTNPIDYDTDGDGLPDGYEVHRIGVREDGSYYCDPLKYDTDGNGTADGAENPDNDSMACYTETMNVIGVKSGSATKYYCSPEAFETATEAKACKVLKAFADSGATTNFYVTTRPVECYEQDGKWVLVGDLTSDTWVGRYEEEQIKRGEPVRLMRGTRFSEAPADDTFQMETVTAAPAECYVAFQYNGGYARAKKGGCAKGAEVTMLTAAIVKVLHYHVYQTHPYDPRTGWFHTQGSVETAPYTHMDEFLSMVFWHNVGQISESDMVPTASKPMTTIWAKYSTSPVEFDTDQDGMPDGWEFYLMAKTGEAAPDSKYSPLAKFQLLVSADDRDNDKDALEWPQEYSGIRSSAQYGWSPTFPQWRNKTMPTDPWKADTDGDGVLDGYEGGVAKAKSSGDGSVDYSWEAKIVAANFMYNVSGTAGGGLNPLSWDTDMDGLPDPWEIEFSGTYKAGSTVTTTYEIFDDGSKSKTSAVTGSTVTVSQLVGIGATWNMDGMDGTVPDDRLDYDADGLDNWQEYMVGSMRCWRYDDTWSGWGVHANTFEGMPTNTASTLNSDPWNKYWHDRLLDVFNETGAYNPNLANGYFDAGSVYFSCCTNAFDSAKGSFYMFRDGVYHDLQQPVWGEYSRFVYPILQEYLTTGEDTSTYNWNSYPNHYICCDPRMPDTDYDGMDDFYEIFHGMNPLLGKPGEINTHTIGIDGAFDVVFDAYARTSPGATTYDPTVPSAVNNWWFNGKADHLKPTFKNENLGGYDFIVHPWLNGIAGADPDGDNIVNQEEAIMPSVQAVSTYHHSDPTPLWMTDTSYTNSLTRRYYKLTTPGCEEDTGSFGPILATEATFVWDGVTYNLWDFPGFTLIEGMPNKVSFAYSANIWSVGNGWAYSFEENEGYDSDHDFLSDYEEAQGKTKNASNVQDHDDPLRRQPMYFNGKDAFLQTPVAEAETVPVVEASDEAHQLFLYFTVECWAKPDAETVSDNSGQLHALVARSVYADNSGPADEKLLRRNFLIGVKNGKWYACYDGSGADANQTVEVANGPVAGTGWAHVAATFNGEVLKLYVNGTCQGSEQKSSVQPEHGAEALAVDKTGAMNEKGGTEFFDSSCITITVGAVPTTAEGIIYDYAWRYRSFARRNASNPQGLHYNPTFERDYGCWYKGYIDEVRIWDGARSDNAILTDYENRTRYTAALAEENRQAVYAQWKLGGRRADNWAVQLPAQLMYHFAFDHIAGAVQSDDLIQVPAGFGTAKNVTDAKARWVRPDGWVESCWANAAVKSTVYTDNSWVPWINNTVSHLPRFDLTTLDSAYWSENYAGAMTAAEALTNSNVTAFSFPRSNEVYSRWTQQTYDSSKYYDSHYDRDFSIYNSIGAQTQTKGYCMKTRYNVITGYYELSGSNTVHTMDEDLMKLKFAARDRHLVGDDILPMGGAYPKRISLADGGMWDAKQGESAKAADAWAQTGKDSDNNGLPDWWEEYARANYCKGLRPRDRLDWGTTVSYYGISMTAYQAYLRDLAKGLVKIGSKIEYDADYEDTRDNDKDGLPDWWEELYGLDTSVDNADADPDNDGLSNYQEYLIAEVYPDKKKGYNLAERYGVKAGTINLNPTLAYSTTNQVVTDYYLKYDRENFTNVVNAAGKDVFYLNEYFGEMVNDHDFMEDWWEDLYGVPYTNSKKYDPLADKDGDGWSTWAECRASLWGGSFAASLIDQWRGEESDQYVIDYPQPIIQVRPTYYGKRDISGRQLVVRTTNGQRSRFDAVFVVPELKTVREDALRINSHVKYIGGFIADNVLHGHLSPGAVNANSIVFRRAFVGDEKIYTFDWSYYVTNNYLTAATIPATSGTLKEYVYWNGLYSNLVLAGGDIPFKQFADTIQSPDGTSADIYIGSIKFGTVNCITGEYELDMSKFIGEATVDQYLFEVEYATALGHEWPQIVYLSDTKELTEGSDYGSGDGFVREGKNTIEAFIDMNDNEVYDLGEPYGVVKDVDVGWHKTPVTTIELRDDSNIMPRYVASENDSTALTRKFFVRRSGINGTNVLVTAKNGTVSVPRPVLATAELVMDVQDPKHSYLKLADRNCLTEADVLNYDRLDLDWGTLESNLMTAHATNVTVNSVSYDIVEIIDNGDGTTSNAVVKSFVKSFNAVRGKPTAVSPLNDAPVYANSPTFAFSCDDETMTAYRLQIRMAGGTELVYDSGCQRLPARTPNTAGESVYEVTPAIYAGTDVFVDGSKYATNFVDGANYEWRVALFNAKYMSDSDETDSMWSSTRTEENKIVTNVWAKFQMDIGNENRYPQIATGCGSVSLAVRYYGPTNLPETADIYVEAFESADFRGQPVARAKVCLTAAESPLDSIGTITGTNAVLRGVTPGVRYIRAFVDANGNGQRDAWESWGYVNNVGKGVKAIYNPIAVEVTTSTADWKLTDDAQYTLFIEDTDVDQNEVPDCLQPETDFAGLVTDDATRDTDGDGLKDYEESFYGTDPTKPDTDGDGLNDYEEVVTYGTSPTKKDTDDDGMDDYWEVNNGTDPTTDDAGKAIPGDVMAYAEVGVNLVTYKDETYVKRWAVTPKGETNRLYRTFSYGDRIYVGAPTEWIPEIGEQGTKTDKAVLTHSAVYDWFGYDVTTARVTADGTNSVMGANTKAFTYYDKYVTDLYYLPQFGITYQPVSPNFTDSNNNQIDDGWELYVALARVAPVKSFPVSNEEQIRHAWEHNYDPYDELAVFKLLLAEDPATALNMVPFTNEEAFRMGYADAGSNYWSYAAANDVMAIANEQMYVANKEGKLYAIRLDGTKNGEVSETNRLWTTFSLYGGQLVLGAPTKMTVADVNVKEGFLISTNVTLIHSGVYDWYGFDATTARAVTNAANTAAFTRAWKLVTNLAYLPEFGVTSEPLNLDAIDSNANTIDDGFELYVGFADVAPVKSFPTSANEEVRGAFEFCYDPWTTVDGIPNLWKLQRGIAPSNTTIAAEALVAGEVMAYATKPMQLVWLSDGTIALADEKARIMVGDDATALDLTATWAYGDDKDFGTEDYAGKYGVGLPFTAAAGAKVTKVETVDAVLVHDQVYDEFGFDYNTANPSVPEKNWVNTKAFTVMDKYLVLRYLEAMGLADEAEARMFGLWDETTLDPNTTDTDGDGIPDGWELYVGSDPWDYNDRTSDVDGDGVSLVDEYNDGVLTDPNNTHSISSTDDISDALVAQYHLQTQATQLADDDNDGLSNWAEYEASEVYGLGNFSVTDAYSADGKTLDYFYQPAGGGASLRFEGAYVGEIVADHDFIEDTWEDLYDVDYINRYVWDATSDFDDDGWSNWSEARAGTDPTTVSILQSTSTRIYEYPIPAVEMSVYKSNGEAIAAPMVVQAWSDANLKGLPDASWALSVMAGENSGNSTSGGDSGNASVTNSAASADHVRLLGSNPRKKVSLNLGPGSTVQGSVTISFKSDKSTYVNEWNHGYGTYYYSYGYWYDTYEDWFECIHDKPDDDSSSTGSLYIRSYNSGSSDGENLIVGTINYETGATEIDFSLLTDDMKVNSSGSVYNYSSVTNNNYYDIYYYVVDLTAANVKIEWNAKVMSQGKFANFTLSNSDQWTEDIPTSGHLKEGLNTFVAFEDENGNNVFDPGEPFGIVRDVDVGWQSVSDVKIELTTQSSTLPRYALTGSTMSNQYVRVFRTQINNVTCKVQRVVLNRKAQTKVRAYVTEGDYLKSGNIDVDASYLVDDAKAIDIDAADIKSATYRIILTDASDNTSANITELGTYVRKFDSVRAAPKLTSPTASSYYQLLTACPTFKWTFDGEYASFAIQIAKDKDFTQLVWTNAPALMPAATAEGYSFRAPVYVGRELEDGKEYFWRVALLNAKYTTLEAGCWSEAGAFKTCVDSRNADTGYGKLAVDVRYFGASSLTLDDVVVSVYDNAGFAGTPFASKRLGGAASVKSLNRHGEAGDFMAAVTNVVFDGLKPADWYVMAYIDANTNGVRDVGESWGYVCNVGTEDTDIYTPISMTVVSYKADMPTAVLIMEDCDANQNGTLDCIEPPIPAAASPDRDRDGLTEEEEEYYGTDDGIWDFDGDGMPDGWEAKFAETDPLTADGDLGKSYDVMAYAEVERTLVTVWSYGDASSKQSYLLAKDAIVPSVGDDASALELYEFYEYGVKNGGLYGLGLRATLPAGLKVYETRLVDVALVHSQVYDEYGFDPMTAVASLDAKHTKTFTALDKYLVIRYLDAMGFIPFDPSLYESGEDYVNINGLWSDYSLKPSSDSIDNSDSDKDGIADGWELYVMFGPEGSGSVASLGDAAISPWNYNDARDFSPDGKNQDGTKREDVGMRLIDEYDGGYLPTDPWNRDTDGDNVIDKFAYQYHLKGGDAGKDPDGDGLSNYAEYLITEVFQFAVVDPDESKTNGSCVDYFRKVGDLYLGEIFTDHDQVNDEWEQDYETAANRYVYDPSRDDDGDGWSNWAESKAGTHPGAATAPGVDGEVLPEYPIPAISVTVVKNGKPLNGSIVFRAWSEKSRQYENGIEVACGPDATWTATASEAATNMTKYAGQNPGKTVTYHLGTGVVEPGSLRVWFRDTQAENALFKNGVEVSTSHGTNPQWYYFVEDVITGNDAGELRLCATNLAPVKVGTVDYSTGLVTIDFGCDALQGVVYDNWVNGEGTETDDKSTGIPSSCVKIDLSRSFVKLVWTPVKIDTTGNATYYLSDGTGHVREGLNSFVVFCDEGGTAGEWDPGEPFGFVKDVDVGWQGGAFTVELTETSPVFARINLKAEDPELATDRQAYQAEDSSVMVLEEDDSDKICEELLIKGHEPLGDETRLLRVRVVRTAVNGEYVWNDGKYDHYFYDDEHAVVLDKYFDLGARSYLHEGDFLTDGNFDADWAYGESDIWSRLGFIDGTNITYVVMLGEGVVKHGSSNAVCRCVIDRRFDTGGCRFDGMDNTVKPRIDATQPGIVYGAKPTFRWKMADEDGTVFNSYTAFRIQIGTWTSDYMTAPVRDADGWYAWTIDRPITSIVGTSANAQWRVAMYNAKFRDESFWREATGGEPLAFWSDYGSLVVDIDNQQPMNDHGYSTVAAAVKYAGPSAVLTAGKVYVQAFATADFAGEALGESHVYDNAELTNTAHNVKNATVCGLPGTGTYYLRAFIDLNGNGKKDDWESWGAASEPVVVSAGTVTVPTVGIWIEDADTDGDWLPDAWEYVKAADKSRALEELSGEIIGGDQIVFSGTVDSTGTAGISTGLSGVSLTIFQNKSFITALIPELSGGDIVNIDGIRDAVEKRVNPDTVKITALTLSPSGKTITLSVAAEVTDSIAGKLLGSLYTVDGSRLVGDTAKVRVKIYQKTSLAQADWTLVYTTPADKPIEIGDGEAEVEVDVSKAGIDMTSGFYKIEVVQ